MTPDAYTAAIQFLYGRINYEQIPPASRLRKWNLEPMRRLLGRLGDPHLAVPVIHIAGTKGKGSTASMLSSVLTHAGYRTGLYTSPHLEFLEERFAINGRPCSPAELVAMVDSIRPTVEAMDGEVLSESRKSGLTFFEITTAMAFCYFARREVEIVVLEVGMGGRLDSTNVCQPLISIITSISFDHTKQLGNTLAAIAGEKAGIIKPGVPVVSGVEQPEPREVVRQVAQSNGSRLYAIGEQFSAEYICRGGHPEMSYRETIDGVEWELAGIRLGLLGRHQSRNGAGTLAALRRLIEMGWSISDDALRGGLEQVRCPARIEVVRRDPTVIVDTAHNVASIATLVDTLNEYFPGGHRSLIFAASRDKDIAGMLQLLLPQFQSVYFTRFVTNPRSISPEELLSLTSALIESGQVQSYPNKRIACSTPTAAWKSAIRAETSPDVVCITGSFFLAGELRPAVLDSK